MQHMVAVSIKCRRSVPVSRRSTVSPGGFLCRTWCNWFLMASSLGTSEHSSKYVEAYLHDQQHCGDPVI